MAIEIFFAIIVVITFLLAVAAFIYALPAMVAVGPIPAHWKGIDMALELAEIKPEEVLYDLGCGDGRVLVRAVRNYGCRGVGYDLIYPVLLLAKLRAKINGASSKIDFKCRNMFSADIENADVIFCFLTPELMEKIGGWIKGKKLKNGARIVSYAFAMKNYKPEKVIEHAKGNWNIYLYKINN